LVRQYCKSIGICIAILIKNLYWYWYWQYFFQAVLVLVLPIKVLLTTLAQATRATLKPQILCTLAEEGNQKLHRSGVTF